MDRDTGYNFRKQLKFAGIFKTNKQMERAIFYQDGFYYDIRVRKEDAGFRAYTFFTRSRRKKVMVYEISKEPVAAVNKLLRLIK
jgi:hypothetical protein